MRKINWQDADKEPEAENSTSLVIKVFYEMKDRLGYDITANDISVAHCTSQKSENGNRGPPPVVVLFVSRSQRDSVFRANRKLKNTSLEHKVYVNEDFSPKVQKLYQEARAAFRNKTVQGS